MYSGVGCVPEVALEGSCRVLGGLLGGSWNVEGCSWGGALGGNGALEGVLLEGVLLESLLEF